MRTSLFRIAVASLSLLTCAAGTAFAQATVDPYAAQPPAWNSGGVIAPAQPQQQPQQQLPQCDPNLDITQQQPCMQVDPNAPQYDPNAQTAAPYDGDETIVNDQGDASLDDGWQPEAYNDFQQQLSPYGQWNNDPTYGEVWQPSADQVGYDFSPYASGGNWSYTEYGWTWVSDYSWGWAPFHYGRWFWGNSGWCWRPGRTWGPGWVSWRSGGGYSGWAPLGPRGMRYVSPPPGRAAWHFTNSSALGSGRLALVSNAQAHAVYRQTRPFANTQTVGGVRWNMGPQAAQLGRPVALTSIRALPAHSVWPRASVQTPIRSAASMGAVQRPGIPQAARPAYSAPMISARPAYAQPAYARPAYSQPTYARPAYSQPTYARPAYSQPTYARPAYSQPVYSHPTYSQPSYSAPAATYSHPSYSAPAVSHSSGSSFHSSGGGFHGGGGHR